MKKLRTAVIGLGVISGGHLQSYIENEKTELTAICDKDKIPASIRRAL